MKLINPMIFCLDFHAYSCIGSGFIQTIQKSNAAPGYIWFMGFIKK